MNWELITRALEEACEGRIGSIPPGTMCLGGYSGREDDGLAIDAMATPLVDVLVSEIKNGGGARSHPHRQVQFAVRLRVTGGTEFEGDAKGRRESRVRMLSAIDQIVEGLSSPGALALTESGEATELVSGTLMPAYSVKLVREDFRKKLIQYDVAMSGIVCTTRTT